jgi:hypothetical protein
MASPQKFRKEAQGADESTPPKITGNAGGSTGSTGLVPGQLFVFYADLRVKAASQSQAVVDHHDCAEILGDRSNELESGTERKP